MGFPPHYGIAKDRASLVSLSTDPADADKWGLAIPSSCTLTELTGNVPVPDIDCMEDFEGGAVAWSLQRYCDVSKSTDFLLECLNEFVIDMLQDADDWLMYCDMYTGKWVASTGNKMSEFTADQKWAIVQVDTSKTNPDSPPAWQRGTHIANAELNKR